MSFQAYWLGRAQYHVILIEIKKPPILIEGLMRSYQDSRINLSYYKEEEGISLYNSTLDEHINLE